MSQDAAALKEEGNALFRAQKFDDAGEKYGQAIADATDGAALALLYSNRAQCHLALKRWGQAKLDAAEALVADANHHKSWLRLGRAYVGAKETTKGFQVYDLAERVSQDPALRAAIQQARRDAAKVNEGPELPLEAPSQHTAARAAQLKDEGNAFAGGAAPDYEAAYAKFTLALVFDPTSAILHSNRAFCANQMKLWDLATIDAKLATALDESYVKAWARLGAALLGKSLFSESSDAFKRALAMLESAKQPLSAADSKLKASVVSSLDDLRREKRIFKAKAMDPNIMPWVLASRVIGGPMDFEPSDISTWYSSGWIILPAYQEFVEGLKQVYALQIRGGRTFGSTGAVQSLSNALLTDSRAFFIDRPDFYERYKLQAIHEMDASRGFLETDSHKLVGAVKTRLAERGGWDARNQREISVRKSISTTIRTYFLNAFVHCELLNEYDDALKIFKVVLDFIEQGRNEWATVSKSERGAIFELSFLLGIERTYMGCLRARYLTQLQLGIPDTAGYLDKIKALAEKMLEQTATFTAAERIPDHHVRKPSHILPFIIMPEAVAYDSLGFYYFSRAKLSGNYDAGRPLVRQAAENYSKAAALYPKDEELRTDAVFELLSMKFFLNLPLQETLPVCDELRESIKLSSIIWRASDQINGGPEIRFGEVLRFADRARTAVAEGTVTLLDAFTPDDL